MFSLRCFCTIRTTNFFQLLSSPLANPDSRGRYNPQGEFMRHYEIVFLVHPDQSEQVPAMVDRFKDMVTSGDGKIHRVEDWGRRRLAYMINDVHKAHYIMINIECGLGVLQDIERNFKFNDSVLRHLVIRRKQAITEESNMARAKAREDAADAAKEAGSASGSASQRTRTEEKTPKSEASENKPEPEKMAEHVNNDKIMEAA